MTINIYINMGLINKVGMVCLPPVGYVFSWRFQR